MQSGGGVGLFAAKLSNLQRPITDAIDGADDGDDDDDDDDNDDDDDDDDDDDGDDEEEEEEEEEDEDEDEDDDDDVDVDANGCDTVVTAASLSSRTYTFYYLLGSF
nr:unnamed protein product [Spirometra erinaceieuropaei]